MWRMLAVAGSMFLLLSDAALACRPMLFDPIDHVAADRAPAFTTVFVGEVVGMRKPQRVGRLRRWWSESAIGTGDNEGRIMPVVVGGGLDLELEVFPTRRLRGKPEFPETVTLIGCVIPTPEPELGDVGVMFVTEEGWGKFVQRPDESGYGVDPDYLEEVRACLTGDCNRE